MANNDTTKQYQHVIYNGQNMSDILKCSGHFFVSVLLYNKEPYLSREPTKTTSRVPQRACSVIMAMMPSIMTL